MAKLILKRENGNINIDGNLIPFRDRWVARLEDGTYIDHDRYSNDLKERYGKEYEIVKVGE